LWSRQAERPALLNTMLNTVHAGGEQGWKSGKRKYRFRFCRTQSAAMSIVDWQNEIDSTPESDQECCDLMETEDSSAAQAEDAKFDPARETSST
jgi:hypothetical protein